MNDFLIATPVSTLIIQNTNYLDQIIELSDCFEIRDFSINYALNNKLIKNKTHLFHCELQAIHLFTNKQIDYIVKTLNSFPNIKGISLHASSCFKNPKFVGYKFEPNGTLVDDTKLLCNFRDNINILKKEIGKNISIFIENNNFYHNDAYKYVCEPTFLKKLCLDNDVSLLLDISHAKISVANMQNKFHSLNDYISQLPLNQIKQVHISKHSFKDNGEAYDAHFLPGLDEFNELRLLLKTLKNIEYFTIEYYQDILNLINSLKILGKIKYE